MTVADERIAAGPAGSQAQPAERVANLGDILERVLDKGLVIAGDIRVNLLDIELLTIKLRLVIASLETAKEVGIDWWEHDPWLRGERPDLESENRELRERIAALEQAHGDAALEQAHGDGERALPESEPRAPRALEAAEDQQAEEPEEPAVKPNARKTTKPAQNAARRKP